MMVGLGTSSEYVTHRAIFRYTRHASYGLTACSDRSLGLAVDRRLREDAARTVWVEATLSARTLMGLSGLLLFNTLHAHDTAHPQDCFQHACVAFWGRSDCTRPAVPATSAERFPKSPPPPNRNESTQLGTMDRQTNHSDPSYRRLSSPQSLRRHNQD